MGYEKIKRNRYYEPPSASLPGGFPYPHDSSNHYEDQHELHLALERVHQSSLHDWGIATGLPVTGAVGATSVSVDAGAATDINGNLIVLAVDGSGDIGTNPPASVHDEQSVPVSLDLGSQAGSLCYLTISHSEMIRPGEGSGGRMERVPWIRLQPASGTGAYVDDGLSVILAVIDIDAGGTLTSVGSEHGSAALSRRLMDHTTRDLILRRGSKTGNTVSETEAGRLAPADGGGLKLTLPDAGDNLTVERASGTNIDTVDVRSNNMHVKDSSGRDVFKFRAGTASLSLGTSGSEGDLKVYDNAGNTALHVDGNTSRIDLGTTNNAADIRMRDSANRTAIELKGGNAAIYVGTTENEGDLIVRDDSNREVITLNGSTAWLKVGEEGNEGDIEVKDGSGRRVMHFDGNHAVMYLGAAGNEGDIRIRNDSGTDSISMDGATGNITCNGWNIVGNPARKVTYAVIRADDGTEYAEIDLGETKQIFAHISIFMMDPRHDFDHGDAFACDIHRIDGAINPTIWGYGGAHLGPQGANSNLKSAAFRGAAQSIKFRVRSFQDATVRGLGIIYYE